MLSTLLDRVRASADRILVADANGEYTGRELLDTAATAAALVGPLPQGSERIALLAAPGLPYVAGLLAIWRRGAMAVPLCAEHPPAEIGYVLDDADVAAVLCDPTMLRLLPETSRPVLTLPTGVTDDAGYDDRPAADDDPALMLYTSGTTGRPKGAVHTHATVRAMVTGLVEAWGWTADDRILHCLPLHHLHGIVNKLLCPLWVGARCDMLPRFDAATVFERFAASGAPDASPERDVASHEPPFTLFMAVPTIYAKLIHAWEAADEPTRDRWSAGCARLRLMVSGSAALAVPILERWRQISGHVLLERYGMTEIGIALTNPLHGERRPGFVGGPVPGMEVRLVDDAGAFVDGDGAVGELQVRGANVFAGYWGRPDETARSFTDDGWFRTGDLVAFEGGAYRIAGRLSTDIIKSGGYKISALEIENVLAAHPAIVECCVVGVPDDTWGERVGAAVVLRAGATLELDELRTWARHELAPYKLPTVLRVVDTLPRNVMGKVLKPSAKTLF